MTSEAEDCDPLEIQFSFDQESEPASEHFIKREWLDILLNEGFSLNEIESNRRLFCRVVTFQAGWPITGRGLVWSKMRTPVEKYVLRNHPEFTRTISKKAMMGPRYVPEFLQKLKCATNRNPDMLDLYQKPKKLGRT